ncbi:MAG: hypothetical protein M3022_14440 [Actinomycetota bacterium]|nr:hypothetical protein [Actinomycetota bacterium]
MTAINDQPSQVADCECGAQFAGTSRQELLQRPGSTSPITTQLLGALEFDVVSPMVEERRGALSP